jgi:hypothetical protein
VQLAMKEPRAAIASYEVALDIRKALVARDGTNASYLRDLFYSHYKLAHAYASIPDRVEAEASIRAAAEVADRNHAAHPKNETYANDAMEAHFQLASTVKPAESQAEFARASAIAHEMLAMPGSDPDWAKTVAKVDAKLKR